MDQIRCVFFDFGGVLAEEGFHHELRALARRQGLDPQALFATLTELIYTQGYAVGRQTEAEFWAAARAATGLTGSDQELREPILSGFVLRPYVFDAVRQVRQAGAQAAILSDHVNWLDEINGRAPFFHHFDRVFNSFHQGVSKRDPEAFRLAAAAMTTAPEACLLLDDNPGNIQRAASLGMHTIRYDFTGPLGLQTSLRRYFPGLTLAGWAAASR